MEETNKKKKATDYGSFNYSDYVESDSVKQAKDDLSTLQKPGAYQSQWQQSLNDAISKIQNREKFSYDLNGDALYQQYKDQAVLGGQMAMQDTMGQAAAMTGGYGNSYAQGVGQQAYQGYLQQLNDKVPELYQLALDQYNREGDDLYSQYALMVERENTDYGRHRDEVSDYNTERGYLTDQYNAERDYDYSKYADDRSFKYGAFSDDRNLKYQVDRDAVADAQWQQGFDEGVRQFDESMAFDKEQFDFTKDSWEQEFAFTKDSWQKEFNQRVSEFDQEYKLKVRQIEEDIRHNKITEAQGQQQINLAREELAESKRQAEAELSYKYAALKVKEEENKKSGDYEDLYEAGVAYLKENGVPDAIAAGAMTQNEWAQRRNQGNSSAYGKSYEEYIELFLEKHKND